MQFSYRKKRHAPAVIIVSLIDVLIVVLIFLMVTTTTRQQPAIQLALPQSHQAKSGGSENLLILTVSKTGQLFLKTDSVTMETLQARLVNAMRQNPQTTLAIRADTDTAMGRFVGIMDAAKAANIRVANVFTSKAP